MRLTVISIEDPWQVTSTAQVFPQVIWPLIWPMIVHEFNHHPWFHPFAMSQKISGFLYIINGNIMLVMPFMKFQVVSFHPWKTTTGWWLGHPSEKYESQFGWLFPIYGKIKLMATKPPTRQPKPQPGHPPTKNPNRSPWRAIEDLGRRGAVAWAWCNWRLSGPVPPWAPGPSPFVAVTELQEVMENHGLSEVCQRLRLSLDWPILKICSLYRSSSDLYMIESWYITPSNDSAWATLARLTKNLVTKPALSWRQHLGRSFISSLLDILRIHLLIGLSRIHCISIIDMTYCVYNRYQ